MTTVRETDSVDTCEAAATSLPARHAEQLRPRVPEACRWPTTAIRELTMVAAEAALAADPELKYMTCQACADRGARSVIALEAVACQHRIPAG